MHSPKEKHPSNTHVAEEHQDVNIGGTVNCSFN